MTIHPEQHTLISVVTPAYNGEQFVRKTYDCLLRQTYPHWEWVVVNDGSTDATHAIMQELQARDARISYCVQPNSGAAKYPRDHAVALSKGELILPLDIDDRLSDDYLELMLARMLETDADIVYPRMIFLDVATGRETLRLPVEGFDSTKVYRGRDLVKLTMPEWQIGCNGGLYRRAAWINMSYPQPEDDLPTMSDEVDERLYQIHAERVAFAPADYYYQNHESSITTRVAPRYFHYMFITHLQLADVVRQEFGTDSEEGVLVNRRLCHGWRTLMACYARHYREQFGAEAMIEGYLRQMFHSIRPALLTRSERAKLLWLCNFELLFALFCLKYRPRLLMEKLMQRYCPRFYRWAVLRRRTEGEVKRLIAPSYTAAADGAAPCPPYVVSLFCSQAYGGGLTDRLRGAVSVYLLCQETGREFRLHFVHPFRLTDFLEPADYDWRMTDGELSFDPTQTATAICDTQAGTRWELRWQHRRLTRQLQRTRQRQLHCYTNSPLCYDKDFALAFRTLFRPTPRLQTGLQQVREQIGGEYITVSARFCNLLGDFNEEVYSEPLSLASRRQLLNDCIGQLRTLKQQHPGCRLVVCSDSTTFLQRAQSELQAYVVPGTVTHIANDAASAYEHYEKTFLDFFTIAQATHVYLLLGPGMMRSGFPYAAALSQDKPFTTLTF